GRLVAPRAEHLRFPGAPHFTGRWWPAARRAVSDLEGLRAQRLGPAFREPDQGGRFGILPESASHEGYLAQPVHAYWDDFWALRGLGDAVELARALGHAADAEHIEALRQALSRDLY